MKLQLDPWGAEYGAEFSGLEEGGEEETPTGIDLDVEQDAESWSAVEPPASIEVPTLMFVDGVRRLEARALIENDGVYGYGAFGAGAVGAVKLDGAEATFDVLLTDRVLAATTSELPVAVTLGLGLEYRAIAADAGPDGPLRAIHNEMRRTEERLGRELSATTGRLVVADGPLTHAEPIQGDVVGYVKRVMRPT